MTIELTRVGDVLELVRRSVPIEPLEQYELVGAYSFGKGLFRRDAAPGVELGDYKFFAIEPGDLVLSNIQAWEGAIALARQEHAGLIGTHRFLTYIPKDGRIGANWARWFFLSEPGMALIRRAAPGTAVRNRTLSIDRFEDLEIPLPSIAEQTRTAFAIDRAMGLLRSLGDRRAQADHLMTAYPLSQSARLAEAAATRRVCVGDLLRLVRRPVVVDPLQEYAEIGIRSFGKGIFHKQPVVGAELGQKRVFEIHSGELVLSNVFAWEGAVAVTSDQDRGRIGSHRFMTYQAADDRIDVRWAGWFFRSKMGVELLGQASPGSAGRNRTLSVERFEALEIPVPPVDDQRRIAAHLDKGCRRAERLMARQGALLKALSPSLLNQAFAHLG